MPQVSLVKKTRKQISFTFLEKALVAANLLTRLYAAFYMIIADCDETFNYWEALNLMLRRFGKQTWEYSPEYAIRSYAFLVPYYMIAWPLGAIKGFEFTPSYYQFYVLRIVALCGFTSYAELSLYRSLRHSISSHVSNWFLLFTTIAPGMSHAGVALLPSSFAMQCNMMALSQIFAPKKSINRSVRAITWFLIGGLLGWPFALALGVPYGFYSLFTTKKLPTLIVKCTVSLLAILVIISVIDSICYSKFVLVPLNIVLYNVFGGEGEGPEIFGTEPLSYYLLNLLLNFNFTVGLAFAACLLVPFVYQKGVFFKATVPMLLWFQVFFSQPHKEERFLYPAYPLICLNASLFISKVYTFTKNFAPQRFVKSIFGIFVFAVTVISALRTINLVENYSAPLKTFEIINRQAAIEDKVENVCVGKEWYHFPNSFFLPDNYRLRFVRSGFDGLLPGDFDETSSSLFKQMSCIPPNMNNLNKFEADKVISFSECDYYIDNDENSGNLDEPKILRNGKSVDEKWELLGCNKIIDPNGKHKGIGRLLYIPQVLRKWIPYEVEYLQFCALKRQK